MTQKHVNDFMSSLRDFWSTTNKIDFLNIFFEGWAKDDPRGYYNDKWLIFRNSPLQFWCSADDEKRALLHEKILQITVDRNSRAFQKSITDFYGFDEDF